MTKIFLSAVTAAAVTFLVITPSGCGKKEDPAVALKARADGLYAEGKYDDAVRFYDKLLFDYPAYAAAEDVRDARKRAEAKSLFEAARKLVRSGRSGEAEEAFRKALTLAPDDADVNYGIGFIYIEKAARYRAEGYLTGGRTGADYMTLAGAYADLARGRFERSIKLNPKHWAGYRGMAIYHSHRGEYDDALKALDDARKYAKEAGDIIGIESLRIQVYFGKKDLDRAKEIVDRLVEAYPERGETYAALADYYIGKYNASERKSYLDEAIKALEVGVTKKFEDREIRNRAYSLLSQLLLSEKDYEGALAAAGDALADDPFNDLFAERYAAAWRKKELTEERR